MSIWNMKKRAVFFVALLLSTVISTVSMAMEVVEYDEISSDDEISGEISRYDDFCEQNASEAALLIKLYADCEEKCTRIYHYVIRLLREKWFLASWDNAVLPESYKTIFITIFLEQAEYEQLCPFCASSSEERLNELFIAHSFRGSLQQILERLNSPVEVIAEIDTNFAAHFDSSECALARNLSREGTKPGFEEHSEFDDGWFLPIQSASSMSSKKTSRRGEIAAESRDDRVLKYKRDSFF